jgi:signal transduction histidine kinase
MHFDFTQILFLLASFIAAVGLIFIIYSRSSTAITSKLFILTLVLVIAYLVSHTVHFVLMPSYDVTALDISCHSLLLMILVSITFFSWNYPIQKEIGIIRGLLIIIPSTFLLILLWNGNFIHESHAHMEIFSAEFSSLYPLFLFWYLFLIVLNSIWIIQKLKSAQDSNLRNQLLFYLFGLIITNIATFIFGLFLPWILGFYYLVEISPLAFLIGFIFFTAIAIGKYNMFPYAIHKVHSFSLNKKIVFSAIVVVPIIILLVQIPLGRIIFNINSIQEMIRFFLISVFIGVIVSISMSFIISRMIAQPITLLKEKALEIGKGNFEVNVEYNSSDEIGELSKAFNDMAVSLDRNIAERKKLEAEIIRSEKFAALGKMSAVLAHEIKTPLTSIKMNVDILNQTLSLSPEDKEAFHIIGKEINRLTELVKEVLQVSRTAPLKISNLNLRKFVEDIFQQVESESKQKRITFINNTDDIEFTADEDKLRQVFLNMIQNSIDAIEKTGTIRISSQLSDDYLIIRITDDGFGIEEPNNIFDPFFTTKVSGTGLGLSISQKIIEQHNGTFSLISSRPGETIFEIKLPLNDYGKNSSNR